MAGQDADHRRFSFGDFTLDVDRGALTRSGIAVKLRPKSFEVLRYLVEHAGRLVAKDELMRAVWGKTVVTDGSLTQCIIEIRRALGAQGPQLVRTIARRGFIFEPATSPQPPARRWRMPIAGAAALLLAGLVGWTLSRDDPAVRQVATELAATPAANSIAVLRFLDLSPDASQRYFADGLGEEILHLLAQSPELRVTARGSSFAFDPGQTDVEEIARQLDVAYVLEGSVRRANDQVRITARLIDTSSHSHAWSKTYDRRFDDVLQLQSDIATEVARALKVELVPYQPAASPEFSQAHDLFLHGRYLFHRRAPGDLEAAERYLEQAVDLDPDHARAWTALAGVYHVRGTEEMGDASYRLESQRVALERALAIDPGLAEAHERLGRYFARVGDSAARETAFDRAIRLSPDDPLVLFSRARRAILAGQHEQAIELERRAVAIDPLSAVYRGNLGRTLMGAGRFDEALVELRRARELSPHRDSNIDISRALLLLGRLEEARHESREVKEGPARDQLRILAGQSAESATALERLQSDSSAQGRILLAEIAAFRGDPEAAFASLAAAAERIRSASHTDPESDLWIEVLISPFLRSLHEDPRWEPLVAAATWRPRRSTPGG